MNVLLPRCFGPILGAGFLWTPVFHTTSFEGCSGVLVFFSFMPVGALICAVGMALIAARGAGA